MTPYFLDIFRKWT